MRDQKGIDVTKDKNHQKQARISSPTARRDDAEIIDISNYAPFLLNAVSNAWGRTTSTIYRRDFGLGLVDWRVISMLNIEPNITARRICDVIRLDKAAVSRSLKTLLEKNLLQFEQLSNDPRKRLWSLSDEGLKTHNALLAVALSCESDLVSNVSPDDLEVFLKVMRQMLTNIDPV